ncbi:MAG TPA: hypothetical protein VKB87_04595 [Myxococcaceae bacterium]|nr:hypothetical protein [Myxococcaceae bacterium]
MLRGNQEVLVTSGRAGILKTPNGGQSWIRQEPGLVTKFGVEPYANILCQSRSEPEIVYVATIQDGISRTADFGETWEPLTQLENPTITGCAVDPVDAAVVYALAAVIDPTFPGVLFKSVDSGRSFSTVGAGLPTLDATTSVAVAPTNRHTVYIADSGTFAGLYVSPDGGLNFDVLPNAPVAPFGVYPHPTLDGTLLVFGNDGLFMSTDGGASFSQVGAGLSLRAVTLAFDTTDASLIYAAAREDGLFLSVDGALHFERLPGLGEEQLRGIGVDAVGVSPGDECGPPVLFAGTSLGPFRSDDRGQTFIPIHNGYRGTQVNDLAVDASGRLLVAAINTIGVFRSITPGDYQFIGHTLPRATAASAVSIGAAPSDPELYIAGSLYDGMYRTTDGGQSWTPTDGLQPFGGRQRIAFAPSDASRVYVVSSAENLLLRSSDGGQYFEGFLSQPGALGAIAIDPHNADVLYVGTWSSNQGLFKSVDGGRTLLRLGATGNFAAIALDPQRPFVIYAGLRFGSVIRSLDGGASFAPADLGLVGDRVLALAVDPTHPMRLFVWMHAGGLFQSDDGADSWSAVDTGETLRRSTAQAGQTAMAINPSDPEHVYVGNGSVLQAEFSK